MPQSVSTLRSTAKARVVLALSLIGWVVLCSWVWMLLGESKSAVGPVAVVDPAKVSATNASSELDGTVTDSSSEPDETVVDVESAAVSEPASEIVGDVSEADQGESALSSESVALDTESMAELGPVPGSAEKPLPGYSDLFSDLRSDLLGEFPDPEGLGEVQGVDTVTIPLAAKPMESAYERQRREELAVLTGLSASLRFEPGSAERSENVQKVLDRIFDPLFLYADMNVEVKVNSNDLASPADNRQLGRLRGQAIVDYLAQRGLDTSRFVVVSEGGRGLAIGTHRVQMISEASP